MDFDCRTCVALLGLYFPNFFLQLNAIKRGIDPNFAFYTVRPTCPFPLPSLCPSPSPFPLLPSSTPPPSEPRAHSPADQHPQRLQHPRPHPPQPPRPPLRPLQRHDPHHLLLRRSHLRALWGRGYRGDGRVRGLVWVLFWGL